MWGLCREAVASAYQWRKSRCRDCDERLDELKKPMQNTLTHCNTPQHHAIQWHCNTLQHRDTATQCNAMSMPRVWIDSENSRYHCYTLQQWQHAATYCIKSKFVTKNIVGVRKQWNFVYGGKHNQAEKVQKLQAATTLSNKRFISKWPSGFYVTIQ